MKTLVLGMGNPILSDDAVGLFIALSLQGELADADVVTAEVSGLNLLDLIQGYDQLIVIDALISRSCPVGTLQKLPRGGGGRHFFTSHGLGFFEVMELGKTLGLRIPTLLTVYGIEIGEEVYFGRELSPVLVQRAPDLRRIIMEDIQVRLRQRGEPAGGSVRSPYALQRSQENALGLRDDQERRAACPFERVHGSGDA